MRDAKKILVIGSLNLDMVVNADHVPLAGETILGRDMTLVPGGKGANQACAAARLGAHVVMLGALGQDGHGRLLEGSLAKSGVDVSRLLWRSHKETGLAMITVDRGGENSIVVVPGANATLTPEDLDANRDLIEGCDGVILQMEIPIETVCHGARLARSLGKRVILDPAPVPEHFPEELYLYADVLKPNETELGMLTGIGNVTDHLEEAWEVIRQKGGRNLVVTLGEKGAFIASMDCGIRRIPAVKVAAVDTTAAGDAFTAALAHELLAGRSLTEAAKFANFVSAMVVTRKGAQSSIPSMEEVEEYRGLMGILEMPDCARIKQEIS